MRLVAIGDVGVQGGIVHIGDEAMFEALLDEVRVRGVRSVVAISNAPTETARRYGVDAIDRIGFMGDRGEMAARLATVSACLDGDRVLPADDPVWRVIAAVEAADAVAIAGGGNMASNWPLHIYERAALGMIARRRGRPLVVTGQTLGPTLTPPDRDALAPLLDGAALVGVREHASFGLAAELGVERAHLVANRDDASFLGFDDYPPEPDATRPLVVSLSTHLGGLPRAETVGGLARALDGLVAASGLSVIFHPHFGSLDPAVHAGDQVLHDEVRAAMRAPSEAVPPGDARSSAALARSAAMLVTSRYHPTVFATPAGIPVAALVADDYTGVKLRGATGWWDQQGTMTLEHVAGALGAASLVEIWESRHRVAERTAQLRPDARADHAAWWDRVVTELGG
ncbi:polysaccharide pyruvyl transferase family protein [uncultured Microbacterium sp.]|uniref:polysaccharide pyruvyl transferase family protein n=1 Tax=uncultured Microbacterium sp. TaxID=191216 RepID=UPI0035C97ED7